MVRKGWSTVRLGDVFESRKDKGTAGLPTLSVTLRDGLVERDSLERKTDTNLAPEQHLRVEPGDIAYNMMRMWQGASGLASFPALVSPAYVVLKPTAKIDPPYAAYLFKSPRMIYMLWAYSYGLTSDRLRLYFDDFSLIPISLPPIEEQRRIAEILGTWDRAIETTEKLIAASEAQKKALMQQLLTGKKRLRGFEGEWRDVRLGDVAELTSGHAFKSSDILEQGECRLIRMNDLKSGITKTEDVRFLDNSATAGLDRFKLNDNDFVFGMTGSLSNYAWIDSDRIADWYLNQRVGCLRAKENQSDVFLQQLYLSSKVQTEILKMAAGAAQLNISLRDLRNFRVSIPDLPEQLAIASVLQTGAAEVLSREAQLQTLKTEKAALMQQLLTGKRRVNLKEMAA